MQVLSTLTDASGDEILTQGDVRDLLVAMLAELQEIRLEIALLKEPGRSKITRMKGKRS